MKKIILTYIAMVFPMLLFCQLRIKLAEIEIKNIKNIDAMQQDNHYNILIKARLYSECNDTIKVFRNGLYSYEWSYVYNKISYVTSKVIENHNLSGDIAIPPGSYYNLVAPLSFNQDAVTPTNFIYWFLEIMPTLIFTMIDDQNGIRREIKSEKVDWAQITIQADTSLGSKHTINLK